MSAWQTIETAPKDRFVLLWCRDDESIWMAKWQGGRWFGVDDEGLTRDSGIVKDDPDYVTHWQPLPPPPVTAGDAA